MPTTWGIKLGTGCKYGEWCRRQTPPIIGIGWEDIKDAQLDLTGDWEAFRKSISQIYPPDAKPREIGSAAGTLFRFIHTAKPDDYVWYYDPNDGKAYLNKILSHAKYRDFAFSDPDIDVWHIREVKLGPTIALDQLHGDIYSSLRYPKLTFWSMDWITQLTDEIWTDRAASKRVSDNADVRKTYDELLNLVEKRLRALTDKEWETLTAAFLVEQGGHIEGQVGGNREGIDVEAVFPRGLLPQSSVRFQVKKYTNRPVDWPEIDSYLKYAEASDLGFVSAYGFTPEARREAEENGVILLDEKDMARFVLTQTQPLPEALKRKLGLEGIFAVRK